MKDDTEVASNDVTGGLIADVLVGVEVVVGARVTPALVAADVVKEAGIELVFVCEPLLEREFLERIGLANDSRAVEIVSTLVGVIVSVLLSNEMDEAVL